MKGVTTATHSWKISTTIDGIVQEILFHEGQKVGKGDLLVVIDSTISDLNLVLAEARVKHAELVAADKESDHDRLLELNKRNATSQAMVEDGNYAAKEALVDLEVAKAELAIAQHRRDRHNIYAPADGLISATNIHVGELYKTAFSEPFAEIVQLDPIHVRFSVLPLNVIARLRDGGYTLEAAREIEFEIILPDGNIYGETGKPFAIGYALDPETGEGSVLVEFENPKGILRPGLPVQLRIVD